MGKIADDTPLAWLVTFLLLSNIYSVFTSDIAVIHIFVILDNYLLSIVMCVISETSMLAIRVKNCMNKNCV